MKVDRLVSIIMLLLNKERIGAQELADMFEVSPRTIYRDIDAINLAGIPILSTSGVGGGFEIMPSYKIDKHVFSSADLSAILMGLSGMSGMIHGEELVNALAKVKSFIPAEKEQDIKLKAKQILIDLNPWNGNIIIQPYLEMIQTAMQEHRLLSFDYIDGHSHQTTRKAEPYQLVLKGSQWYWQGYCYMRNDFRLFRVCRMSKLHIAEDTFSPRDYPAPLLELKGTAEPLQIPIKLRIHQTIMDRLLDYCAYESFIQEDDAHYIVNFPFIENDYYYDILLSFGSKCECLEPLRIREEIKRRIQELAHLYFPD